MAVMTPLIFACGAAHASSTDEGPAGGGQVKARIDLASCALPDYPPEALAAGDVGRTTFRLHVTMAGEIRSVALVESSGFSSLDEAASGAIRRCRVTPATENGRPVDSSFTFAYNWKIPGRASFGQLACSVPVYPEDSLEREEQGTTTLSLEFDSEGRVIRADIALSSGFRALDRATVVAMMTCRVKPMFVQRVVSTRNPMRVEYAWRLADARSSTPGITSPSTPAPADPYRPL